MKESSQSLLQRLRAKMRDSDYVSSPLNAYIVTTYDAHLSEYQADAERRIQFLTGFTGSEAFVIVTQTEALLWTDGRYHIQASEQLDENWTLMKSGLPETPTNVRWLLANLEPGSKIGADPQRFPFKTWLCMNKDLKEGNLQLVSVNVNLVDLLWEDAPPLPAHGITPQPIELSGKSSRDKIDEVRAMMNEKGAGILIVSALDDIAWALNLRGSDVPYCPVFYSFLVITLTHVHLFIDKDKITLAVRNHFNSEDVPVSLHAYDRLNTFISTQLAQNPSVKVWVGCPASYYLYALVPSQQRIAQCSPISLLKAIKNETEVTGMINAHIKDAVALCRYFCWLENEVPSGRVTEVSGADQLEYFRKHEDGFMGLSFPTISSSGPNGAKNHYRPTHETDRPLSSEEIYLCDSGAQFLDGTTDVTRTMHFGTPSEFQKLCFTNVLKGQIALATTIFPCRIKGNILDVFARKSLWNFGLDYLHGTGHGIGSYLNVHEGPMGIGPRNYPDDPGLQVNMFLSNEPGYYEEGQFGIRLENIVQIIEAKTSYNFANKDYLTFRTITLVPIQRKMIDVNLLTPDELKYLDDYHAQCRDVLGPILKDRGFHEAYEWLIKETEPLSADAK